MEQGLPDKLWMLPGSVHFKRLVKGDTTALSLFSLTPFRLPSPDSHLPAKNLSAAGRSTVSPERIPRLILSGTVDGVSGEGGQTGLAEAAVRTPQYSSAVGVCGGIQSDAVGKQEQSRLAFPSKDLLLCSLGFWHWVAMCQQKRRVL